MSFIHYILTFIVNTAHLLQYIICFPITISRMICMQVYVWVEYILGFVVVELKDGFTVRPLLPPLAPPGGPRAVY